MSPFLQNSCGHSLVMVVDDDAAVRSSLLFSLDEGYAVRVYADAGEILGEPELSACDCLILDQRLSGMSGLELLSELRRLGVQAPATLMTIHRTPSCSGRQSRLARQSLKGRSWKTR